MKDSNGGDIPGTVLESINASEGLETAQIGSYVGLFSSVLELDLDASCIDLDLWAKKCAGFGVNPTHSLETGI